MTEITIRACKFHRLLDYLARIDLDAAAIAASVDLSADRVAALDPEYPLPARHYSSLYRAAARQMQQLNQPIPWAAGLGGESFELMCHCMISGRTLGDALRLAERFDKQMYPLNGYRVCLLEDTAGPQVRLGYTFNLSAAGAGLIPADWDRADSKLTVARSSGLRMWHALCGWLIGQSVRAIELRIDAPPLSQEYHDSLVEIFDAPVYFDAAENTFSFDRALLDRRVVHTGKSLTEFLKNSVYHLIEVDSRPASTSAAIKSLVSIELSDGTPSFAAIASMLYMSESSLRRCLQGEQTSYQAIKDEVRCEVAIDKLLNENARVADLAELLGFTEASSFVRSFKNWTGHTPKSYKDRMQSLGRA
ncbi:MAG: AraC family transcriptional regulator ligand-binding domain-containing protein [Pseudomonadales bacterium]|nr:AraC family transcriptional regulator ligand-binding domain-containing protein [Halioglobus sp.]MCP5192111.1 AraC family transcriptional regulator ligand-binding domain-containing protein [Pseudomonadales bacterium]